MGNQRRRSSDRLKLRSLTPRPEQDTLKPCPACAGEGRRVQEAGGKYKTGPCRWCEGIGSVDNKIMDMFEHWRRILKVNREAGRCP